MVRRIATVVLATGFATLIGLPLIADELAEDVFSGSLIYDSQPYPAPPVANLPVGKVRNESLVVNPRNGGIANAVVSLTPTAAITVVEQRLKKVVVQATDTGFSPHVVVLQAGDQLQINNKGTVAHNINIASVRNVPINEILSPDGDVTFTPAMSERWPVSLRCNIKSWMTAWIVVSDSPHVAVTDENGEYQFRNVTPGEYDVKIWHEKVGAVKNVDTGNPIYTRTAEGYKVRIEKGSGDLGRIALAARLFGTE